VRHISQSERAGYFRFAFARAEGYACIALLRRGKGGLEEHWFTLPEQFNQMVDFTDGLVGAPVDAYFCPQVFSEKVRRKEFVRACPSIWADLDECPPDVLELRPSLVTESSPGRFQALWVLDDLMEPAKAAEYSKRLAYQYASQGADRSGWDLTQLLRIPGTTNHKYRDYDKGPVVVRIIGDGASRGVYREDDMLSLPPVTMSDYERIPMPTALPVGPGLAIMEKHRHRLKQMDWALHADTPQGDWSKALFQLEMDCFEAGMSKEEVFVVCGDAACNKFRRNGLDPRYLWEDVCRAYGRHNENMTKLTTVSKPDTKELLSRDEAERVENVRTFVEEYIDWASSLGDAAVQYHQGGAFIVLSALLGGSVSLPTSFGRIKPNLWFMILADTTLTRKSTAMDIAIDMLADVDSEVIMATDGSIEGLMQGLSTRPGKPSIFLRDEFSGLIEQMTKKDYYAGMAEVLTKLYDGKLQKRLLRKEVIEVRDPNLIIFAGGIKTRVQQLLKFDHVSSGFIPRFLFLTAESDASKVRPLGPPTQLDTSERDRLTQYLIDLRDFYTRTEEYIAGGMRLERRKHWEASLTPEAWTRFGQFESQMLELGLKSERSDLMTPLYDRLTKSALKAMLLLATVRSREESVLITLDDVLLGIKYAKGWMGYAIDVVNGIGQSATENQMTTILNNIRRNPGINRSTLMRNYHLSAREADAVFTTLEQRGLIERTAAGKGTVYNALA